MFIIFNKTVVNELLKRGFVLRYIDGTEHNMYYFDDSTELEEAVEAITEELESKFELNIL